MRDIIRAIAEADLFVAVLHATMADANVYMEIAYAQALQKRALIVVPPQLKSLPRYIMDMVHVRADPTNSNAIGFALDQILAAPRPEKVPDQRGRVRQPIVETADMLIRELEGLGREATRRDLERIVSAALETSSIPVARHAEQPRLGVDLVIWADELNSWLGNPVLVHIKKDLGNTEQIAQLIHRLSFRVEASGLRGALVLHEPALLGRHVELPPESPVNILFISIRELLDALREGNLAGVVRRARNRQAHPGGS